ncbi:thiol-disulfide oxidoreductase DCC family protein [Thermomonas sp.]|uniref:thiol-disulfide oxidoreductase DCC family protein n=1 Tax=Thermomonas sp. TaxID=1971895 RepID=UPI0035B315D3
MDSSAPPKPTLYYDGGCPVCAREIAMYRRQPGAGGVEWVDVAGCDAARLGPGLTREAALARLHLRLPDGRLLDGAAAFAGLWRLLPRWAWLGHLLGNGWRLRALEAAYRLFLRLRPAWRRRGASPPAA